MGAIGMRRLSVRSERGSGVAGEEVGVELAGVPLKVKGRDMLTLLILGSSLAYIVWDVHTKLDEHHHTMLSQSTQLQETMDEFVFIQSLPEEKRLELRLTMPDSLRRKVRTSEEARR